MITNDIVQNYSSDIFTNRNDWIGIIIMIAKSSERNFAFVLPNIVKAQEKLGEFQNV